LSHVKQSAVDIGIDWTMGHHAVMNICPIANINYVGPEFARIDGRVNVASKADPNPYVQQMTTEAHVYDGHGKYGVLATVLQRHLRETDRRNHSHIICTINFDAIV